MIHNLIEIELKIRLKTDSSNEKIQKMLDELVATLGSPIYKQYSFTPLAIGTENSSQ